MEGTDKRQGTQSAMAVSSPVEVGESELDLLELIFCLLERWKLIAISALLCAAIAAVYALYFAVPIFEARAKIYVLTSKDSAVNLADLQIGAMLAMDYPEVFKTWEVHEMVRTNLGLDYTYKQLQDMLTITNPDGTRILYITVRSPLPNEATSIANEYATVSQRFIAEVMATEQPNIFSVALVPSNPIGPGKTVTVALGFLIGGFLAVALIFISFLLDDRIKTVDDISKYASMPTLAIIPVAGDAKGWVKTKKRRKK